MYLFPIALVEHWDVANWVPEGACPRPSRPHSFDWLKARLRHKREWASPNLSSLVPPSSIEWEEAEDEKWAEASNGTWGAEPTNERREEAGLACEPAREACRFSTKPVQCNQPEEPEEAVRIY